LTPRSIVDIEALDDVFLKHWGDKKDLLYYLTKFGNLQRENGELLSNFNKRFNHLYSRIPAEVKPTPTSTKLAYTNAFDSHLCLLLRERRCASLADMQDAALEVESNIITAEELEGNADRRRQRGELSSSSDPKIDKMARMIESLASEVSKLRIEQRSGKGQAPYTFSLPNLNLYRGEKEQLQSLQRNRDQRVKTLLQNIVMEEEQFEDDDEVHGMEDKGSAPFLTRATYEKSLSKGPAHNFVVPVEQPAADPIILKVLAIEVRGLEGSPSSLSFQSDIQKPRIHMLEIGPVKNEPFKKYILEEPEPKANQASDDYANLQVDQLAIILSPIIKKGEISSPSSDVPLSIQGTIPHNCPLGNGAIQNSMPKADMDDLSLDIPKPDQLASTQLEREVFQIIEEEGA